MSFLEALGLESLLGDDGAGAFGCGIFVFGLLGWGLLALIRPGVIDQGAMVFNLLVCIILLVVTIKKLIKVTKEKKVNYLFTVISSIIILISFIYGLTLKYHSIIYNYEYNHICSGIALTFIPTVIINFMLPFFYRDNEKIIARVKYSLGSIGFTIVVIIEYFMLGQIITVPVGLLSKENAIYGKFTTYHNISFNNKRVEIKNKSLAETFQETFTKIKTEYYQNCTVQDCDSYIKENYASLFNESMDEYGYQIGIYKSFSETESIIRIVDREYYKDYYYYKLNLDDYTITSITSEEFNELYQA